MQLMLEFLKGLELTSELADFNAGKTELISFNWSNDSSAIDLKKDGSVLEEKSCWDEKMLRLPFSSKLNWGASIVQNYKGVGC